MARKYWWSRALADQLLLVQNFNAKIGLYQAALGWTTPQVAAAESVCGFFIAALNYADQARATMQAVTGWREEVFYGEPKGALAPTAPPFTEPPSLTFTRGVVTQFLQLREQIVANPGYTESMGEDLGIVGAEIGPEPEVDVMPNLKTAAGSSYSVNLSGSMQGFDAMRVEYAREGEPFAPVAFFTNMPNSFTVTPQTPGDPEKGRIRAVFIKKSVEYGNWSPDYPVTIS